MKNGRFAAPATGIKICGKLVRTRRKKQPQARFFVPASCFTRWVNLDTFREAVFF